MHSSFGRGYWQPRHGTKYKLVDLNGWNDKANVLTIIYMGVKEINAPNIFTRIFIEYSSKYIIYFFVVANYCMLLNQVPVT